jgi:hypothetical protein
MQPKFGLTNPHEAHASAGEIVVQTLNRLGFTLEAEQVPLSEANARSELDFVFLRDGKEYGVEVKYSRKMQLVLMHLLPRALLLLQAAKRTRRFLPIVAIVVEEVAQQDIQRLAAQMNFYAPDVGWLLLDKNENIVFRDPEQKVPRILSRAETELQNSDLAEERSVSKNDQAALFDDYSMRASSDSQSLSFSDLEQWLLKVLLLSSVDAKSEYWGGPAGNISNAFQLSKLADVSPPVANSLVNVMEHLGYLRRVGRKKLILLRSDAIVEEWREKYRFNDNKIFPHRSIYPVSESRVFFEEILGEIKECNKQVSPLAITGHQAAAQYGIRHSSAKSIHIYFWGSRHSIAHALNLVPTGTTGEADLFLVEPKHRQSVFRGRLERDGIPVCDIMQCYLDLFHLADRGQEQANLFYDTIISRVLIERKPD